MGLRPWGFNQQEAPAGQGVGLCPTQGGVIPGMPHSPCPVPPAPQPRSLVVKVTDFCPLGGLSYSSGPPGTALRASQFYTR